MAVVDGGELKQTNNNQIAEDAPDRSCVVVDGYLLGFRLQMWLRRMETGNRDANVNWKPTKWPTLYYGSVSVLVLVRENNCCLYAFNIPNIGQ